MSQWYNKERIKFCKLYNEEKVKESNLAYKRKMWYAVIVILAFFCIGNCYLVGLKKVFWMFIYFITLRWLLVYIYNIRHKVEESFEPESENEDIEIPKECKIEDH